ncbi:MAG: DoxX [Parcubacteria group bacterium GW2011_GWA1_48_11b]|uniref:DoxX subfamily n=3 Tax=Parcubacteria group TaxID=1794811 RepID=A0A1G2H8L9_9BACT|nr:MAG: DoxX [Parcubacteria group bacterium GW2011_GWA2_47_10b]KKU94421.1 MAG: DoxX [Parcubacteria group bacterium GW2011_GWA1_48_11b]OGZ53024.1 MAG: hypothetical protein A3F26_01140 [Candidatus Ryanbacteria bacterium RIFCSPHIGHO2_12_FULL_47_12b]OGZ56350.1 MAG: hypothetical protein A3J04_03510 [Candidatus Ryanbacteria bacterium RIFCSPLOWO2_02_FULL_47_14]OGZ58288.1 MAG: hypothetical protein A3G60_01115 [Candidatus Ryanbacteria bacterium RIFCSPLOWO2_12_FULL_47_9c]
MKTPLKILIFLLRITLGWVMLYAGVTKIIDPEWTAAGFLKGAKTFPDLYAWFASPVNITWVNFLNEWGLTFLGVSLILGVFVRYSSPLGALLMMLYYFANLEFPYPNPHSYLVDEHIIYALVFLFFAVIKAGKFYGFDNRFYR